MAPLRKFTLFLLNFWKSLKTINLKICYSNAESTVLLIQNKKCKILEPFFKKSTKFKKLSKNIVIGPTTTVIGPFFLQLLAHLAKGIFLLTSILKQHVKPFFCRNTELKTSVMLAHVGRYSNPLENSGKSVFGHLFT